MSKTIKLEVDKELAKDWLEVTSEEYVRGLTWGKKTKRAVEFAADLRAQVEKEVNTPCTCDQGTLKRIEHPANCVDWENADSSQGYVVWQCSECGCYWGERYQFDAGTGSDDRWHNFGKNIEDVKRHY